MNHVSTLAHLTCKTYAREISSDEKVSALVAPSRLTLADLAHQDVRDYLIETIRQDYSALTAKTEEASFEILYTQWKMETFLGIAKNVQGLQQVGSLRALRKTTFADVLLTQALITSSSALDLIDTLDPEGVNVKRLLLAKKETASTFAEFRRCKPSFPPLQYA